MNKTLTNNYIKKSSITDKSDLEIINKTNITYSEYEYMVNKYSSVPIEKIFQKTADVYSIPEFSTDDASMLFDLEGSVTEVPKIKFSIGGGYTKVFQKLGFNIKVKKGTLMERKQIRLRAEVVDPSFIREKLAYDFCNKMELPSLSANFAHLFINDRDMGLYSMRDAFKPQWVEYNFGEKSTKHLYECNRQYGINEFFNCKNDDEEITNDVDFKKFQERLAAAKTREDLEEFFDTELFLRWEALKYLLGSWDHMTNYHNKNIYMFHNNYTNKDRWMVLLYDFDSDFGAYKKPNPENTFNTEIYEKSHPLHKLLNVTDSNEEIIQYMAEFMMNGFNPKELFQRIDELTEFLAPYIKEDRTPDKNGKLPGRVPRSLNKIEDSFSYGDFRNNTEFTKLKLKKYDSDTSSSSEYIYGIKQWVLERFRFACSHYNIDCSYAKEYLDDSFKYTTDTVLYEQRNGGCAGTSYNCCKIPANVDTVDDVGYWAIQNGQWCFIDMTEGQCWSENIGYPCCQNKDTKVTYHSKSLNKDYGTENGEWCGINDIQLCPKGGSKYKCCETCKVSYTDSTKWGVEHGKWCSIPYSCDEQKKS
ncbi:coth-domain-containing protein [Piromyces finnis]|uniref:Coth-domain-containing protein n=1 Tax=Piromyces finnis TaxID=1754191 RepID=A0A1Y1V4I3_9FUNG|nr:coth-domain-containing protein [Piromyces finnis]|eukprot:ORX47119.1 coth-domain-containing protein [Piromyces finnis]